MRVEVGRIFDAGESGLRRVLVDRLWPRGVRKEGAPWDDWAKDLAPSNEVRVWYHAHPEAVEAFADRYRAELLAPARSASLDRLVEAAREGGVVLLTAAREPERGHPAVLRDVLLERAGEP